MGKAKVNFIYLLKLTEHYQNSANWTSETMRILGLHAAYLESLAQKGKVYLAGRTQYDPGHQDLIGITMLSVEDEAEAREIIVNDPSVLHGLMSATLHPYEIAISSQN